MSIQSELRRGLELELSGSEGRRLLEEVVAEAALPAAVENWSGLAQLLNGFNPEHPTRDRVLTACFARRDASPERAPVVETALLALFWPMLEAVHNKRALWESDADTRWSDILFAFHRAIRRFNPEQRRERISGKIYNDVLHDLNQECSRRRAVAEREIAHEPTRMAEMMEGDAPGPDAKAPDRRNIIMDFLGRYRRMGVIDDVDGNLLEAILADGLTVKAAAARVGLSNEAAKKRKQRAEAAIEKAAR